MSQPDQNTVRVDKWLWAARFFKTRGNASEAVSGGKVHVNGQRIKPSRPLRVGDRVHIQRDRFEFDVTVTALADRRGPAKVAQTLYAESDASIERRTRLAQEIRNERQFATTPARRPDKRGRRQLRRLQRGE